jgi:peptidyl-tRNA hydrolase, PTH1 family
MGAEPGSPADEPWLVAGLGNPGERYAGNRHNVGYRTVDELATQLGGKFTSHRSRAHVLEGRLPPAGGLPGPRLILAKPSVFMNESGGPVAGLLGFYRVPLERLIVVHDELDLPFGVVRLKQGGGEGGHNGLRSISRSTGSTSYCRVRLGIGRPPGRMDPADFVLRDFASADREEVALMVSDAADAILGVATSSFSQIQNQMNTRS